MKRRERIADVVCWAALMAALLVLYLQLLLEATQ